MARIKGPADVYQAWDRRRCRVRADPRCFQIWRRWIDGRQEDGALAQRPGEGRVIHTCTVIFNKHRYTAPSGACHDTKASLWHLRCAYGYHGTSSMSLQLCPPWGVYPRSVKTLPASSCCLSAAFSSHSRPPSDSPRSSHSAKQASAFPCMALICRGKKSKIGAQSTRNATRATGSRREQLRLHQQAGCFFPPRTRFCGQLML